MAMQRELTIQDYVSILKRRWLLIAGLAILGGGVALGAAHFLPKRFTSQTTVLVSEPAVSTDFVKPVVGDDTNQRLAAMQEQILSRTRLEPVIRQLRLFGDDINHVPVEELVTRLQKTITVTPIQAMAETRSAGLPGFTVSVTYTDPLVAQRICSTITSMFTEENSQSRQDRAEQTTQFLGGQLDDAKAKLDEQDAKLAAFKRRYLGSLPDQEQTNLNLLTGLTSQLDAATQALSRAQQDKSFAESMLAQQMADFQASQQSKTPETYDIQLAALQAQLVALKARYTDSYPDVIKLQGDIEAMKKKSAEAAAQQKDGVVDKTAKPIAEPVQIQPLRVQVHQDEESIKELSARQEAIQQQIKLYQDRVQSSPSVEQEYKELTRDYQTALDFYNDLLKKRDQSAMATDLERQQQSEQFQVLDAANIPNTPSFPNKRLFAAGGFGGGLLLGLAISMFLELQDTSVRNEKEVELLLHIPVLATIPTLKTTPGKDAKDPAFRMVLRV